MLDQVEWFAIGFAQAQRVPAQPDDEVGLSVALIAKALQAFRSAVVAVTHPNLARPRRATLQRLRTVLVVQLQMVEAAAAQVEHPMHPPVRPAAGALADRAAVRGAQEAAGPTHT